jgi:hypothetical protein
VTGRDGFGAVLRAEWTKLRTVRRWVITLFGAAVLIVSVGLLAASSSGTDVNRYPNFVTGPDGDPVTDEFTFVHQPIAGDGTITARVAVQRDSGPDAGAGLIIKANLQSGSRYVAVRVTPGRGVHLQADFKTDVQGSSRTAPVWLRLTRQGGIVTAYESADGAAWSKVGQVKAAALPRDAQIGFFVSSPPKVTIERQAGSTAVGETQTLGTATFDNVRLDAPATGATTRWSCSWRCPSRRTARVRTKRPAGASRRSSHRSSWSGTGRSPSPAAVTSDPRRPTTTSSRSPCSASSSGSWRSSRSACCS